MYDESIYIRRMYYTRTYGYDGFIFIFIARFCSLFACAVGICCTLGVLCLCVCWYCVDSRHLSIFIGYYLARLQYCVASIHFAV